jgi:hypothetical protein
MWAAGVVPLNERGGSGHVRGAPLDYLSFPFFGGLAFSYVFSILSIPPPPGSTQYHSTLGPRSNGHTQTDRTGHSLIAAERRWRPQSTDRTAERP